jgi:hypothetical protein
MAISFLLRFRVRHWEGGGKQGGTETGRNNNFWSTLIKVLDENILIKVFLKSCPTTRHAGAWGERRYSSYSFLTSALDGVSGQRHAPAAFYPGERTPGTHCTGYWVGPRAGLDTEVRRKILLPLPGIEPRSSGRPVRRQTLYWLSYPGSVKSYYCDIIHTAASVKRLSSGTLCYVLT